MLDELSKFLPNAAAITHVWADIKYRKVALTILGIFFGYLGLMWGLSLYAETGAITMAMWAFVAIFSFLYWQPVGGLFAAFVEWRVQKDDPKKKSTWRLYLMVLVAAIIVGEITIALQLLEIKRQFPIAMLVPFIYLLKGLLTQGEEIEGWLPVVSGVMAAFLILGTWSELNPPSDSEKATKEVVIQDAKREDKRRANTIHYVKAIMNCEIRVSEMSTWTPKEVGKYGELCNEQNVLRGISFEQLAETWPEVYQAWERAKTPSGASSKAWQFIVGLGATDLLLFLLIGGGVGTITYKVIKKPKIPTANVVATSTTGSNGFLWLLILAILGYVGYQYRDAPQVSGVREYFTPQVETGARYIPAITVMDNDNWRAQYDKWNDHITLPQDRWAGKKLSLVEGSYITDKMDLTIFDPVSPGVTLSFKDAKCKSINEGKILLVCQGSWYGGGGLKGAFSLEVKLPNRDVYVILMFREQFVPNDESTMYIKKVLLTPNPK